MKKKKLLFGSFVWLLILAMTLSAVSVILVTAADRPDASAAPDLTDPKYEVMPDTWVFTDLLGRASLTNAEVGDPRDNKTLAMFYWTWHSKDNGYYTPFNIHEFMLENPEAKNDYQHPGWTALGSAKYFWNEPLWGYYRGDDEWVLRKQAEMLANAGVDAIFTDNTNGTWTWKDSYDALFAAWTEAAEGGVNSPKVSFMLPFSDSEDARIQMHALYDDIYSQGRYQDLWFYWDEKPMLMGYSAALDSTNAEDRALANYFTFRQNYPNYRDHNTTGVLSQWGWLSAYPQAYYYGDRGNMVHNIVEQTTVGVALNYNYRTEMLTAMNGAAVMGRSYTSAVGRGEIPYPTDPDAKLYGYNFAEQFDYALTLDPEVIFVTGWNEWIAGRQPTMAGIENAFFDQYNDEYSRDLEPSRGDLGDCYYYQLVNYVRQYKGARPIPTPSAATTIDIEDGLDQWNAVEPFYAAYQGNTDDRDHNGYGDTHYSDFSGRNDIIGAQVARDDQNVYFLVECAENISPYTDPLWMNLYIDCDPENQGWETFDYVINKTSPSATHAALERFVNGYESETVGTVEYTVDGRYMQVAVPKSMLGLEGNDFTINFSWTDNVHDWDDHGADVDGSVVYSTFSGDILDFYTSGDVAPGMRFKYSYVSTEENATEEPEIETETDVVTEDTTSQPLEETEQGAVEDTTVEAPQSVAEETHEATDTTAAPSAGCKASFAGLLPTAAVLGLGGVCLAKRKKH